MKRNKKIGIFLGVCVGVSGLGALSVYGRTIAVQGDGEEIVTISCPGCGEWISMDLEGVADGTFSCYLSREGQSETATDESAADENVLQQETDAVEQAWDSYDRAEAARLKEEEKKQEQEYETVGIERSADGCWIYEGEKIRLLLDEAGGLYSSGDGTIYVYVSRDVDGHVEAAEKVTGKRLLEEKAADDASRE